LLLSIYLLFLSHEVLALPALLHRLPGNGIGPIQHQNKNFEKNSGMIYNTKAEITPQGIKMNTSVSTIEKINSQARKLPESFQKEVLHFIEFLINKAKRDTASRQEDLEWYELSLAAAVRGIEDEDIPDYTEADFKEK
jgi:hypothetical protein